MSTPQYRNLAFQMFLNVGRNARIHLNPGDIVALNVAFTSNAAFTINPSMQSPILANLGAIFLRFFHQLRSAASRRRPRCRSCLRLSAMVYYE